MDRYTRVVQMIFFTFLAPLNLFWFNFLCHNELSAQVQASLSTSLVKRSWRKNEKYNKIAISTTVKKCWNVASLSWSGGRQDEARTKLLQDRCFFSVHTYSFNLKYETTSFCTLCPQSHTHGLPRQHQHHQRYRVSSKYNTFPTTVSQVKRLRHMLWSDHDRQFDFISCHFIWSRCPCKSFAGLHGSHAGDTMTRTTTTSTKSRLCASCQRALRCGAALLCFGDVTGNFNTLNCH